MSPLARIDAARRRLADIARRHAPAALASSFGAEDMVLIDLISRDRLAIAIFTIDTGRLPRETHALMASVRRRYGLAIEVYEPRPQAVEDYVDRHGLDGFYGGVPARKACCDVRKVEPLRRALAQRRGWITGLRRDQAESRAALEEAAFDPVHGMWKFNPLADWGELDVWHYLRSRGVPYNALHDRGYPSIGCEPCTRAVKPGEHPRAGRWWWERDGTRKECGLHDFPAMVLEAAR